MKNFGIIIVVVLSLFLSSSLVAQEKMTRGKIVVSIGDDFVNKKSEIKYFLQRPDTTLFPVPMEHIGDSPPRPGQRAILSPNGKLHFSRQKTAGITFNKISGKIRVLIALIQPSDEDAPWEAEKAKEYFQSSKDFFEDPKQHSKVELELSVVGWVKSAKTKSELTSSTNNNFLDYSAIDEAINLTDDSVNYQEVDCLFIVVADNDWTWTGAWASIGKPGFSTNDGYCQFSNVRIGSDFFSNDSQANSHEIGHAVLGQYHAAGRNTSRENECNYSGETGEYKGLDVMGYVYFFLSTLRQYLLGWLPEERVIIISHSSSVELCPREVENANEKQLVIVENDGEKYFTIELCEKDLETYNNNDFPAKIGYELLVNEHGDVVNNSGYGGYDLDVFLKKDNNYESFLHPGEEICGLGKKGNISIKYVSLEGEDEEAIAKVEVTIVGAPEPTPTPSPSPEPTPSPFPSPTPTSTPEPTPSPAPTLSPPPPTPTPSPSPSPYPTPTEPATADIRDMKISSKNIAGEGKSMILRKRESVKVVVEPLASGPFGDIPVPNVAVSVETKNGKGRIKISPLTVLTDANGQATFIITAKKKIGIAKIIFKAGSVKKSLTVKVK